MRFVQDVGLTKWLKECGVGKAIKALTKGELPKQEPFRRPDGTWVVVPKITGSWKGKNAAGLRVRFFELKKQLGITRK
jgi:hypothetical protein